MDLSPTDLRLVSYDLYKTDEKYDFKLTDILRRRHRPVLLILDSFGDLVYSCRPDEVSPDGDPILAIDGVGAGPGELVILTSDGRGARELMKTESTPVRWTICGICD